MNNGGFTDKHPFNVSDNYGIAVSYICYNRYVKDNVETFPKTTLFKYPETTENRGKENTKGKED